MVSNTTITLAPGLIRHAMAGAIAQRVDVQRLLRKCDIDSSGLNDDSKRIPVESAVKLHRYCNGVMNDELNGLLHKPFRVGSFRMMALAAVHAPSIGEALHRYIDFINLFENSLHYSLDIGRKHSRVIMQRIPGQQIADDYAIPSLLAVLHRFAGWLGNDRILLQQVTLDFSAPDYKEECQYMFYEAPVLYNQNDNSISFESHYLDHPVVQTEAGVESYVRRAPMDLYLPLSAGGHWTTEVRNHLKQAFVKESTLLQLDQLAERLELNPQTLRRRLKTENTSFDTIKAQLRRDIAIHHLGESHYSIEAIAEACGYTEPSAFIRAFKSWTGFTPLQFRKGLDI